MTMLFRSDLHGILSSVEITIVIRSSKRLTNACLDHRNSDDTRYWPNFIRNSKCVFTSTFFT